MSNFFEALANLISRLSKIFKPKEEPKPQVKQIIAVPWDTVVAELKGLGLVLINKDGFQPDYYIQYVDEEDWQKLVPFLTFSGEYYVLGIEPLPDCDDYAKKASVEAAFKFHVSCLETWGDTPYGRHAFSLVKVGEKAYRIFEPNAGFEEAGELFKFGEYRPDCWRL